MLLNYLNVRNESYLNSYFTCNLYHDTRQIQGSLISVGLKIPIQISQLLPISVSCEFEVISIRDNFLTAEPKAASELAFAGRRMELTAASRYWQKC